MPLKPLYCVCASLQDVGSENNQCLQDCRKQWSTSPPTTCSGTNTLESNKSEKFHRPTSAHSWRRLDFKQFVQLTEFPSRTHVVSGLFLIYCIHESGRRGEIMDPMSSALKHGSWCSGGGASGRRSRAAKIHRNSEKSLVSSTGLPGVAEDCCKGLMSLVAPLLPLAPPRCMKLRKFINNCCL